MTRWGKLPFTRLPVCFHTVNGLETHTRLFTVYQRKQHMHNNMQNEIRRLVCFLVVVLVCAVSPCSAMHKASCCLSPVQTGHKRQTADQVVGIELGVCVRGSRQSLHTFMYVEGPDVARR
jgi:hypothetical protein